MKTYVERGAWTPVKRKLAYFEKRLMQIPVVVQYRHAHLSQADYEAIFGYGEQVGRKSISHYGQQVDHSCVQLIGNHGTLHDVAILGPARTQTQIELSLTDAAALGVKAPVRVSGDTSRAGSCVLKGSNGELHVRQCVIVPARHVHLNPLLAKQLNLIHGQIISLLSDEGDVKIDHVTVRVHPTFANEFHLTTDEAAAYWIQTGDVVRYE